MSIAPANLIAAALAVALVMPAARAEESTCPTEQYVCDANRSAFACYVAFGRRLDDSVSDEMVIARSVRLACDGLIEYALARRWHSKLNGEPDAPGIDEKWKTASAEFLRKEGAVLQENWYDEEMDKIVSVIKQLRALRIKR